MEYLESLITYFTDMGVSRGIAILYLAVTALIAIMAVVVVVMRVYLIFAYHDGNTMKTHDGRTSVEVAREALDKAGLKDIKIKKASWFRAFFYGNCYSITKRTIFLRRGIFKKNTITAVGIALQKVGVAKLYEKGDGLTRTRNIMQLLSLFGPILFIPVILLGFILDLVLFQIFGVFSIIGIIVGVVLVASGLVATLLNLPVEKKANAIALDIIKETGVLNEEETVVIKKVFKAYIVSYVCEFIAAVLRIVQVVLEIIMNQQMNNKGNG